VQRGDKLTIRGIFRIDGVAPLLTIYFLVMMGFNFYYITFPVYAAEGLQWSIRDIGLYFSVLSVSMVIAQGPILSWASKKLSEVTLTVVGSLLLAVSFLFYMSQQISVVYLGGVLLALGNGLMWPSVLSMLSKAAGSRHQGAVQGFASSFGAVASIVGLVAGGALYANLEARVFLVSSVTILIAFFMTLWLSSQPSRGV
jgi:MFS family permease